MNFPVDWHSRRNLLNQGLPFGPMHYTISNYSTDSKINEKSDMKCLDDDLFTTIQTIPDPLKKNLADSVITMSDTKKVKPKQINSEQKMFYQESPVHNIDNSSDNTRHDIYNSLTGITSFFSNVFGAISGAVFYKRPKSPAPQYYDCFQCDTHMAQQMAPDGWHFSNLDEQNKKIAPEQASNVSNDNMSDCKTAVAKCEDKLNAVRSLLKNKPGPVAPKFRGRRPKRAFVQPNAVTVNEEAIPPDQYVSLPNEEFIEYISLQSNHNHTFTAIDGPKMKTEVPTITESAEIVKILPEVTTKPVNNVKESVIKQPETAKAEIISACEDKMAKLKSLLQNKSTKPKINIISPDSSLEPVKEERMKKTKVITIEKPHDKRFKNPNRLGDKRLKSRMRKNIQEDTIFANEIDSEEISSIENSPRPNRNLQKIAESETSDTEENDAFDEMKGRFHSASTTDSEDSFQIVFSDSPKLSRMRRPSDCDSEDSFIVFEDTDKCYTSNDVFGDHITTEESDADSSDCESDVSDSGCGSELKLTHTFSRTVSDLTDESLYEETKSTVTPELNPADVVDCAVRTFDEIQENDIESVCDKDVEVENKGVLIDEVKKLRRKGQPPKKVSFSSQPPKVHVMRVWAFAARQARAGHWERHALDRERFKRRIADVDMAVSWVLKPQHRRRVMFQRFMPWWHQQKRKEAAEKKIQEEERKKREEEERIKREEDERIKQEEERIAEELRIEEEKVASEKAKESEIKKSTEGKGIKTKVVLNLNNKVTKKDLKANIDKFVKGNAKKIEKVDGNKKNMEIVAVNDKLADLSLGLIVNDNVTTN